MSPFSASSQNSDASVASDRVSLPTAGVTSHVSQSQVTKLETVKYYVGYSTYDLGIDSTRLAIKATGDT